MYVYLYYAHVRLPTLLHCPHQMPGMSSTARLDIGMAYEKAITRVFLAEPFNDDGTFQQDVFFNTTGTAFIPAALNAARAADPNAKLYINEFNTESPGPKSTAMQNLVKELQAEGVPIDGVGFQCHFIVGEVPTTLVENFEAYAALGIEFAVTELDVRMTLPETDALLEQQKKDYQTVIDACLAVPACVGVTVWDFTDKFSWVPGAFAGQGAACPWDEVSLQPWMLLRQGC